MLRAAPRCFAPQFAPPSPSLADSEDSDPLPSAAPDRTMAGPGTALFGGRRPLLDTQGYHAASQHPSGTHRSRGLPGAIPRAWSQPKAPLEDLSLAFAGSNDSGDEDSDDGTVLDAPLVSPGTVALAQGPATVGQKDRPQPRASALGSTGKGATLDAPVVYPPMHFQEETQMPSPATVAIAAAAAEMRSHEHKMTRYRKQLRSGERSLSRAESKDFQGQGIRTTASSNIQDSSSSRPATAALSTRSSSMPSQSLDDVGSPSLEAEALAICRGLPGHAAQSAPSMRTKSLRVVVANGVDEDEDDESAAVAEASAGNPWDITATSTPRSDSSELYPAPAAEEPCSAAKPVVPHRPTVAQRPEGATLLAPPVQPAPVRKNRIIRSVSEDRKPGVASRMEALHQEEMLLRHDQSSSGPPSLDGSPAHSSGVPKGAAGCRRVPQPGAPGSGPGKHRGMDRLRSQLGRLALGSSSGGSPVHAQKNPVPSRSGPVRMTTSGSYDATSAGYRGTPPRTIRDLYPIPGVSAPLTNVRPVGVGMVRNARSLSPASWRRDFPNLDIPFNSSESPRSPPKPIAVAPPAPSNLQGRRR